VLDARLLAKALFINIMKYLGQCSCGKNEVVVEAVVDFERLVPRSCDCESCRSLSLPAAMVSDPSLNIFIVKAGDDLQARKNGSEQASFLHCKSCGELLAVGANVKGKYQGAVNAFLFKNINFSEAILVRPRLLSPAEKLQRWKEIWGNLHA
jgi:hypothetical protein